MDLAQVIESYGELLEQRYHQRMLPSHHRTLNAIMACRKDCGEAIAQCKTCATQTTYPLSCGNRSCPKCQNGDTTAWINRQSSKLLPVPYFMVTFTLPQELRNTAWCHQKTVYAAMFKAAVDTLKTFGLNPKQLGADIGFTGVLHTHNRRLDYHPHLHFIVPGGGIDNSDKKKRWRRVKNQYLFNGVALSEVFRGKLMYELISLEIDLPPKLPTKWVVHCKYTGKGLSALKYLSRYLYRGVITKNRILNDRDGKITFSYKESKTDTTKTRTLKGEDFLWLVLQHVLPKGFRRIRDYGFLHSNAKKKLNLVQLILSVKIPANPTVVRNKICCRVCDKPMLVHVVRNTIRSYKIAIARKLKFEGT